MEEPDVGARVVLSTRGGLAFAGAYRGILNCGERAPYRIVETDAESGFCIMCPQEFVDELLVIPLGETVSPGPRNRPGARRMVADDLAREVTPDDG
jgi:hypothetical protein